jgi:hypothetical protein
MKPDLVRSSELNLIVIVKHPVTITVVSQYYVSVPTTPSLRRNVQLTIGALADATNSKLCVTAS